MIKRKVIGLMLSLTLCASAVFADAEKVAEWGTIYEDVTTDDQRIAVLLVIMDFKDRDFNPVLGAALETILSRRIELGTPTEVLGKTQIARLIVQELGDLKTAEYADLVYQIYNDTKNIPLKSDAAYTLGQMRAAGYAPALARDLRALNANPSITEKRDQEILALALVRSLNEMRDPIGCEAVFMASIGWYSAYSKVRETAKDALVSMVDDPTATLQEIMEKNQDPEVKLAALSAALASKAPAERKTVLASRALSIGLEMGGKDPLSITANMRLRVAALSALAGLGDKTAANIPLYIRIVLADKKSDSTFDETVKACLALGVNGSDEAATFLASQMTYYNDREKQKANTPRDKLLLRQILASMKAAKNPVVRAVLQQALLIDYDAGILSLIRETLGSLPQ